MIPFVGFGGAKLKKLFWYDAIMMIIWSLLWDDTYISL